MNYNYSKIKLLVLSLLPALGSILFFIGFNNNSYIVQLFGIMIIWLNNIIFSLFEIHRRIIFFFLNITIFVLLLSRPFIATVQGNEFWYFAPSHVSFALTSLYLTLLFMYLGSIAATVLLKKKQYPFEVNNTKVEKLGKLFTVSFILYLLTIICTTLLNIEKFIFANQTSYLNYHSNFVSHAPAVIKLLSLFSTYALCVVLATFPKKNTTIFSLILFILSAVPLFLMGSRNALVLNTLFSIVYFIIRDFFENKNKWIGRKEKLLFFFSIPPGILLLGAMNYIRGSVQQQPKGFISLIVDFFYKQGTTFDTLNIGHKFLDKLPFSEMKLYTFGPFLDAIKYGIVSQVLFGSRGMNEGNNYYRGMASYQLANNLDYVSRWKDFFDGNGFGSSYILETFFDFGYLGVVIFSILIGLIAIIVIYFFRKDKPFLTIIILVSLTNFFFLPRDSALRWLVFFIKPSFWVTIIVCFIGVLLLKKVKILALLDFVERKLY